MMFEFFTALSNPFIPFLRYALFSGLLSSVAFGVIGSYVVARRISSIAGAIAHSVLGGIGLAIFIGYYFRIQWFTPLVGALVAAIISALIIGFVSLYGREREDTVIGAIWAIGMSLGLLCIALTPGYFDPMSYLFGNILLISWNDVVLVAALDIIIVGIGMVFYNQLLAVCFDEEFASLRGIPTAFYYMLLLVLTAITVVLLVRIVGIVMVIALLTLPAAIAGMFTSRLWKMMVLAGFLCMVSIFFGLAGSYALDLPAGPVIIIITGTVYLFSLIYLRIRNYFKPD